MHEKARAEQLIMDARQAIKEEAPIDRLRSLTAELQQVYHGLGMTASAASGQTQGQPQGQAQGQAQSASGGSDEDVIDAEFTSPNSP